jgi:hypothetical protein
MGARFGQREASAAGHSETSILGHSGRFEYSARQSEQVFLSGTNSHGLVPI